jgi:DNA-binding transcriptional LysR family regulator
MLKNLTTRQLRIFEAAATTLSFSRAAEQLHLTQPAVSMQIRLLEDDAGAALFIRDGKRLQLSEAGRELLRHTRIILGQIRQAGEALTTLEGSLRGQLHLGVVSTAHYFVPRLLAAFRERNPDITLKMTVEPRDTVLAMLRDYEIELAVGGYPPSEAEIEAEGFARHPHCIVAPPSHPLAGRRQIPWNELRDEVFIFREHGSATRKFLELLLQSNSVQVRVTMEFQGNEAVKQAVVCGMGISFLSAHCFQEELEAGRLVILDVIDMPQMVDWYLLHRRERKLSGISAAFRSFVLEQGSEFATCRFGPD